MFSYIAHLRGRSAKQKERKERIESLSPAYHGPLLPSEKRIIAMPLDQLVADVHAGTLRPTDVLIAYGKKALKAQAAINCLTEIMLPEAEEWARRCNAKGPLAGVPVSLKDEMGVAGFDASLGYSAWVGVPMTRDNTIVRLLRDAGAVPFVKTNVPITLRSYECTNDVFGTTGNPHNVAYSPGGSSGGEAALLAYGGSRFGIGSDGAGSVRVPSHYSGCYTIKASSARFLKYGNGHSAVPGMENVGVAFSPMTRTLEDLETVWRGIMSMKPWEYDHSVVPIPWRDVDLSKKKRLRWGVIWDDGVVRPSPACLRALRDAVGVLEASGHEIIPIEPPNLYKGLKLASQLLYADAGKGFMRIMHTGEYNDPGVRQALAMFRVPRFLKKLYAWYIRHIRGDEIYAGLVEVWSQKTVPENLALVAQREAYRAQWYEFWKEQDLDFIITVPNAHPAVPHGGMHEGWKSCGYAFLFNLLDYSAGIVPVTHVDETRDALTSFKPRNAIEAGAYRMYDAKKMHGLPVGVQVAGKRYDEEKVMEGMKMVERLLRQEGKAYTLFERDD